jgi:hypothetical protein
VRRRIERESARHERLLRRLRRAPPEHGLDPRLELARRERLSSRSRRPSLEPATLSSFVGARSHP